MRKFSVYLVVLLGILLLISLSMAQIRVEDSGEDEEIDSEVLPIEKEALDEEADMEEPTTEEDETESTGDLNALAAAFPAETIYFDDFSRYTPGLPPTGWLLRGAADQVTPTVKDVGGTGPSYRLVDFPEVPWQYWDIWLLKDGLTPHAPYTVTVKLNFQNEVADRAGLTIAWNDANWNRIDIQPNVYGNDIEFRVTYNGPIQSNPVVNNVGYIPINAFTNYWLRVVVKDDRPGQGRLSVLWSTDGTHFIQVINATGLQNLRGLVGVSTAGPHLPHMYFDDFSVSAGSGQSPVITLLGANPLNHIQGCPFIGAGATATDAEDGDLTNSIIVTGSVDINAPGQYFLTYSVTDSDGLSDTETRQVIVFGVIGNPVCFVGRPAGKAPNLVVLVHGCCTDANGVKEWDKLGKKIAKKIEKKRDWEIVVWDWHTDTPSTGVDLRDVLKDARKAYNNALDHQGHDLATAIMKHSYKYIHLVGHSAGAKLIDEAAKKLVRNGTIQQEKPFIHLTFLDAFTLSNLDRVSYGFLPRYPDSKHYAEHYVDRSLFSLFVSTDACLASAFNFNITRWFHFEWEGGLFGHQWPVNWYKKSVTSTSLGFYYGFPRLLEGGNNLINRLAVVFPPGKQCTLSNEGLNCKRADQEDCWE